jgi:histidinol-phosphate aminotransferase
VKEKYGVKEIMKLASNENQLGTSPKALEAMAEAINAVNIYPDAFCMEIRKKLGMRFGFDDCGDNVIMSVGASGAISLIAEVFVCEGDEVIFCNPTFSSYEEATNRNNGKVVALALTEQEEFDLDAIKAAITDKTKLIFICNPNNPTGTVVDNDTLRAFIHSVPKHVITVVDEAYIEFADGVDSMVSEIKEGVNLIILRTFSKLYGLAGIRLGYSLMNKEIHAILQKSTSVFVASRVALAGAMAAIDDEEFVKTTIDTNRRGKEYLTKEFAKLGWYVYPSHTNFIYVKTDRDTVQLANECMKKGLIIRDNFKNSRITIGTDDQNKRIVEIMKEIISEGKLPAQ